MRILLSAYACEPNKGSEPEVGWQWACSLAEMGHEVTVLTRTNNRENIENFLKAKKITGLSFLYLDLPPSLKRIKKMHFGLLAYYYLWQWLAFKKLIAMPLEDRFDLIHHVTFALYRYPSFLSFQSKIPFVLGPVGGGEETPKRLLKSLPLKGRFLENIRHTVNWVTFLNPFQRKILSGCALIICRSKETLSYIPKDLQEKCVLSLGIGIPKPVASKNTTLRNKTIKRMLFVGRLLYWKGVHLALKSVKSLLDQNVIVELSLVGSGPDEAWLKDLTKKLGIEKNVHWLGQKSQKDLFQLYSNFDLMLFPSFHDSGAFVVLEALSNSLPVVCLNLGGPAQIIDESCGRVVNCRDLDETEVVTALSTNLRHILQNDELIEELKRGALLKAEAFTWEKMVLDVYSQVLPIVALPPKIRKNES